MFLLLTLQLLLLSTANGARRSRVPGEIIPVSVTHSRTMGDIESKYGVNRAVDLDLNTNSWTDAGSDRKSWLKLTLDQVYCVEEVVEYNYDGSPRRTWTCTSTPCTCQGDWCSSYFPLTVTTNSAAADSLPAVSDCRYGDTVKLEETDGDGFELFEIAVTGKQESECKTLNPTWTNVMIMEPAALPLSHGQSVTLTCAAGYLNTGGNKATCLFGEIVPTSTPPLCSLIEPCKTLDSSWSEVKTSSTLPIDHGVETTLTCEAGYVNKGGNKATCRFGKLELASKPPQCVVEPCKTLDSSWSEVKTSSILPIDHGVETTLTCEAGYVNKGGNKATCRFGKLEPASKPPQCVVACTGEEENSDMFGIYTWPSTELGAVATHTCVYKLKDSLEDEVATKECVVKEEQFADTDYTNCPSAATQQIKDILKKDVTKETKDTISNEIAEVAKDKGNVMSSSDIKDTSAIINKVIAVRDLSDTTLENLISTVDDIQKLSRRDQLQIGDTGGSIRNSTKGIIEVVYVNKGRGTLIAKDSIGFAVATESKDEQVLALAGTANKLPDSTNEENQNDTYFQAKLKTKGDNIATAVYYRNDKSFPSKAAVSTTDVVNQIKDSTVDPGKDEEKFSVVVTVIPDIRIINNRTSEVVPLDSGTNVDMTFRVNVTDFESTIATITAHIKRKTILQSKLQCSFYNETLKEWSNEGCKTSEHDDSGKFTNVNCSCDHLTSFAVLMSFEVAHSGAECEDLITQILLTISLVGLSLTILSYLLNRTLLEMRSTKINLMLSVSMLCSIILLLIADKFVAKEEKVDPSIPCNVIGVLLNYFWLTQLCWMVMEAITLYMALVKVLGVHISRAMTKFSTFTWGTPILFPLIGYGVGRKKFIDPKTCFVSKDYGYYTFYAPVVIGVLTNWILFFFIVKVIIVQNRVKAEQNPGHLSENAVKVNQAKSMLAVSSLLGLGWIVGFFIIFNDENYSEISAVVRWLFILINAPQGFWVFIFFVLLRKDVRTFWMSIFKRVQAKVSVTVPITKSTSATSGQQGEGSTNTGRARMDSTTKITLRYLGKSLGLTSGASGDTTQVMIMQQHCGGNTLRIFQGFISANECFTFTSRRHKDSPIGITIYLDSMLDTKLSTCCEYKYKPGHILGGKSGHFVLVKVEGSLPCNKCLANVDELKRQETAAHSKFHDDVKKTAKSP